MADVWQQLPRTDQLCWDSVQEQDENEDDLLAWIVCVRGDLRARPSTYHVHRKVVSGVILGLDSYVTELPAEEANCVPKLLHFIYNGELSRDNDKELPFLDIYQLAHRLKVPSLLEYIAAYYNDYVLNMENLLDVIRASEKIPIRIVDANPLRDTALAWVAAHMSECTPARARRIPPNLLLEMIKRNQNLGIGKRLEPLLSSKLISHCVSRSMHHRLTSPEVLEELTDESLIPFLHPAFEAPTLLLADCVIRRNYANSEETPKLSPLQELCIVSMTTYWHTSYAGFSSTASLNLNLNMSENSFEPCEKKPSSPQRGRMQRTNSARSLLSNLSGGTHGGFQRDVADQALLDYLKFLPQHVIAELYEKIVDEACISQVQQQQQQLKSPAGMQLTGVSGMAFPYGHAIGESRSEDDEDENNDGEDTFDNSDNGSKPAAPLKPATKDEMMRCLLESTKQLKLKSSNSQESPTDTDTETNKSDEDSIGQPQINSRMIDSFYDDLLDSSEDEDDDDDDYDANSSIFRPGGSSGRSVGEWSSALSSATNTFLGVATTSYDSVQSSDDADDELRFTPIENHYDDFFVHNENRKDKQGQPGVRRLSH